MGLLYLVKISRSRSPQLSPCRNRTQITLKSKQEIPSLVNFTFFQFNNNNNGIYIALIHRRSKRFTM